MKKGMDTFEVTDEQEVCRKCGTITEVTKVFPTFEIHKCPACQYEYRLLVEQDKFEEDEEVEVDSVPSKKSKDFWK